MEMTTTKTKPYPSASQKVVDAYAKLITGTHLVTIDLAEHIYVIGSDGTRRRLKGDEICYQEVIDRLIASLDKRIAGHNSYRRFGTSSLRYVGNLEGGDGITAPHWHLVMEKPAWLSELKFRAAIEQSAHQCPWLRQTKLGYLHSLDIQNIDRPVQALKYIFKNGVKYVVSRTD